MSYDDETGHSYFESDADTDQWNSLYAPNTYYYNTPEGSPCDPTITQPPAAPLLPIAEHALIRSADDIDTSANPSMPKPTPRGTDLCQCSPCDSCGHHYFVEKDCYLPEQCHQCWNKRSGKRITWCPKCTWETNPLDPNEGWSHTLEACIHCGGTNVCGFDFACYNCKSGDPNGYILCKYAGLYMD
jgi:hypothetical protein